MSKGYIETPLVQIEVLKDGLAYFVHIVEPRYLKRFGENITEPVTEIIYENDNIPFYWWTHWSEGTDETSKERDRNEFVQWLNTVFLPKFVERFEDSYRWYFKGSLVGDYLEVKDLSAGLDFDVKPDPERNGVFFVTAHLKTKITYRPVRPIPRYEVQRVAYKLKIYNDNIEIHPTARFHIEKIHKEAGKEIEKLHFQSLPNSKITLVFGTEREDYEEPIRVSFFLDYEGQNANPQAILQTFESIAKEIEQKPSSGISSLVVTISLLPPTSVTVFGDPRLHEGTHGIWWSELTEERGRDLNFLLETLRELEGVLKGVGL